MKKKKLRKIIKKLKQAIFELAAQPDEDSAEVAECQECKVLGQALLRAREGRDEKLRLLTFQQHRNLQLENENKNLKLKLATLNDAALLIGEVDAMFEAVSAYLTSVNDYQMRNYRANFGTSSSPLEKMKFLKNKVVAEFSIFKQKQS